MKLAFIVSLIAVSFNAERASAIELYNESGILTVLRKNQVLSARDMEAIKNEYPKLEISGSLQFQYINSTDAASNKINEMDIKHANLKIVGRITDKVSLLIEPEYGQGLPSIRDAYIASTNPILGIYAGKHRVPFSSDVLQDDLNLRFAERNLASQISPDRLMGVSALTKLFGDKILLQAGIWSSKLNSKAESDLINNKLADNQIFSSDLTSTGNAINIMAFRIGSSSKGRRDFYSQVNGFNDGENFNKESSIDWGFSYYNSASATKNNTTPGVTGLNGANAYEVDLSLRYKSLAGEIEYANRSLDWWQYNPLTASVPVSSAQTSFSAQGSFLLTENMSLALRQESFVYDGSGKVLKGVYGQDQDNWLTLGLNYYSKEQHTKFQINYILKNESMPAGVPSPKNNTTLIQASTYF
jgi:hypothetical protein